MRAAWAVPRIATISTLGQDQVLSGRSETCRIASASGAVSRLLNLQVKKYGKFLGEIDRAARAAKHRRPHGARPMLGV
jgi:hypothetical protein